VGRDRGSRSLVGGPPVLDRELRTRQLAADPAAGRASLDGGPLPASATLEELRAWTEATDSATSGLLTLVELQRRAAQRTGEGWRGAANVRSAWQAALASVLDALSTHMGSDPTVSETIWWIVRLFVIQPHERIAYEGDHKAGTVRRLRYSVISSFTIVGYLDFPSGFFVPAIQMPRTSQIAYRTNTSRSSQIVLFALSLARVRIAQGSASRRVCPRNEANSATMRPSASVELPAAGTSHDRDAGPHGGRE
jgi:hypothetical protein